MLILNLITSNVSGVNMCSTPRPRTKVKGKAGSSGSILSTMSSEARSSFTERANAAQERRHQISIKTQQKKQQSNASIKNAKNALNEGISKDLTYEALKNIGIEVFNQFA